MYTTIVNDTGCKWEEFEKKIFSYFEGTLLGKATDINYIGGQFSTGVIYIGGAPWIPNISNHFLKKFEMSLMELLWAKGEDDSWKKTGVKNLLTLSLFSMYLNSTLHGCAGGGEE